MAEPVGAVPENANDNCPGTESGKAGQAVACQGCPNQEACASAPPKGVDPDMAAIEARMRSVRHKILVLSGKGGVGKSTFAAQLAFALAAGDKDVGLLDIDICGPSVPRMLGLEGQEIHQSGAGWSPVYVEDNLGVMSIGFMLPNPDDAVIWRGPRKNSLIKQFLKDVNWGEIDYLVVDAPPGTSDEHISIAQYLKASHVDGAVIVTTPQEVSLIDVRKEINFCKKVGIPVLGVVENMSGLRQALPDLRFLARSGPGGSEVDVTGHVLEALRASMPDMQPQALMVETDVFYTPGGGAARMATDMGVPFLGRVPMDPGLSRAAEEGQSATADGGPLFTSAPALKRIFGAIVVACEGVRDAEPQANGGGKGSQNGVAIDPLLSSRIHLGF